MASTRTTAVPACGVVVSSVACRLPVVDCGGFGEGGYLGQSRNYCSSALDSSLRTDSALITCYQEQFPIVERQWETVSQFRIQISQKATLSLRDDRSSSQVSIPSRITCQ